MARGSQRSNKLRSTWLLYPSISAMLGGLLIAIAATAAWELGYSNNLIVISGLILTGYIIATLGVITFTLLIPRIPRSSADRYPDQN